MWLLYSTVAFSLVAWIVLAAIKARRPVSQPRERVSPWPAYALVWLAAALFTVARPGNLFEHYLLWLVLPLGLLVGIFLTPIVNGLAERGSPSKAAGLVCLSGLLLTCLARVEARFENGSHYLRGTDASVRNYRSDVGRALLGLAPAQSQMAVWGWANELNIETGFVQASRYGITVWQIEPNPRREAFIAEFVKDIQASRPALFVDAMSAHRFYFQFITDRESRRHDHTPAVAKLVSEDYEFLSELRGVRIYRRRAGR